MEPQFDRLTKEYIINPATGRQLMVGGATYCKMLRDGLLSVPGGNKDVPSKPRTDRAHLEQPPIGYSWRKNTYTGEFRLVKCPYKQRTPETLNLAARAQLKVSGLEETPENVTRLRRQMEDMLVCDALQQPKQKILRTVPVPVIDFPNVGKRNSEPKNLTRQKSYVIKDKQQSDLSDTYYTEAETTEAETTDACEDTDYEYTPVTSCGARKRTQAPDKRERAQFNRSCEPSGKWRVVSK